jgi:uncharacterized protein YqjF (DUF2071 family)
MKTYHFQLAADHYQWYLEDANAAVETAAKPDFWDAAAMRDAMANARDMVSFGTVRWGNVVVSIGVREEAPQDDVASWDHVVDAAIEVPSGTLVVAGCTEPRENAERIQLAPGVYNLRAYYGNLDIDDTDSAEGDDFYNVTLWPGEWREREVIKRYGE